MVAVGQLIEGHARLPVVDRRVGRGLAVGVTLQGEEREEERANLAAGAGVDVDVGEAAGREAGEPHGDQRAAPCVGCERHVAARGGAGQGVDGRGEGHGNLRCGRERGQRQREQDQREQQLRRDGQFIPQHTRLRAKEILSAGRLGGACGSRAFIRMPLPERDGDRRHGST